MAAVSVRVTPADPHVAYVVLTEGKHHQLRHMFAATGNV